MHNYSTIYQQLLDFIPRNEFDKTVSGYQGDRYVKNFKCWGQLVVNLYAQVSGQDSLRDIETSLRSQQNKLYHLGLKSLARSTLAYANQKRDYRILEDLFYKLLSRCRNFTLKHKFKFNNPLYSLDATVIDLCLSMYPWAKFRKRKGGLKMHYLMDYQGEIPSFLLVTDAKQHECKVAKNAQLPLCLDSILCMDKAYIDFIWLNQLDSQGVFFVTRAKTNMAYRVIGQQEVKAGKGVLADQFIQLTDPLTSGKYPKKLRLVKFWDEENQKLYTFLTNNFKLAASTIAAIYKARWKIEIFFKWIKQNLKIKTFLGTSKNAVLTQIWTAMIYYLLLAYIKYQTKYAYSLLEFTRIIRATLFDRLNLIDLLSLKNFKVQKVKPDIGQLQLF